MVKRTILISLIAGLFAVIGGCCAFDVPVCNPRGGCGDTCYDGGCGIPWRAGRGAPCETACEPACEPECEPTCGPACDSCAEPCEEPCGGLCGRRGYYRGGPLGWICSLFHPIYWQGGCGEMYWGDFYGDLPDCCDPCTRMGQFTGSRDASPTQANCGGCSEPAGCETCGRPYTISDRVVGADRETDLPSKAYRMDRGARLVSQTEEIVKPLKKATRTTSTCRKGYCPNKYR